MYGDDKENLKRQHRIAAIWAEMDTEKGDLIERSEAYARWTLPYIMLPTEEDAGYEPEKGNVEIGAPAVNHLANRIVDVLFPVSRPFFSVTMNPETELEIAKETDEAQLGEFKEELHAAIRKIEDLAVSKMNLSVYRPMAIEVAKHLIITGNALIRVMPQGQRVQYGIDRFGVRRNNKGEVYEVVLYDKKLLRSFDDKTKAEIKAQPPGLTHSDKVELMTHYCLKDGRWEITQEAEGLPIGSKEYQTPKDFDLIILTWTLAHNEHYGRGLVEDTAVTFHKLDVLGEAETEMLAIMCDIKFLVRPGSILSKNVEHLNTAPRGSYHVGNEGDVTIPDLGRRNDVQVLRSAILDSEALIQKSFLMFQTRDAERVTAEEVRAVANQLESAFGGLYSRLSVQWQQPEAEWAMRASNWEKQVEDASQFIVRVTTGLESMSREGQVDNLRLAIADMQMLEAVPEALQGAFHPLRFAKYVASNRGVAIMDFLKTPEEIQAEEQQAMVMAGRAEDMAQQSKANGAVQEYAGKAAVDKASQA